MRRPVHYLSDSVARFGFRKPSCNATSKVGFTSRTLTSTRSKVTCSNCRKTYYFKEKR